MMDPLVNEIRDRLRRGERPQDIWGDVVPFFLTLLSRVDCAAGDLLRLTPEGWVTADPDRYEQSCIALNSAESGKPVSAIRVNSIDRSFI
jgi:hypothetical protein